MGGMFGESKFEVLQKIPSAVVPKTILIKRPSSKEAVLKSLEDNGFSWPVIFKPDIGERGYMVKKVSSVEDIENYLKLVKTDFLAQELVTLPLEFGVFYTRLPNEEHGKVTSVVMKEMLHVVGDGRLNLRQLILAKDRAKLQWERLEKMYEHRLDEVLPIGFKMELVSIGNHALGTKFLDGTSLINEELSSSFDKISKKIDGFYFGRFDLKCASLPDLFQGNVKIVELNGCGAEPAHIYDPNFKIWKAISVLLNHWKNIFIISTHNRRNGVRYTTLREGLKYYQKFKAATR
ncbi:hypothetical protein [Chryseosolibacter indicus]|uniref:ATP-grasp domain-containing protein n=1 Tax=Chryseosolibacter indicus TaxID=2782351 RepID=A0ABS5VX68_9BACT|nr:hypothetical protein [Chryseosolibacter indicus]MBT1706015.1 hypothetical protein [Chryseosolibacter indicus]